MTTTVFALYTDAGYFQKARRTILDLRTRGEWPGEVVLATPPSFIPPADFLLFYRIIHQTFPLIDKSVLLSKLPPTGFQGSDKRELHKLQQWEKFHIFDSFFTRWQRVVYLDAGMRILDSVKYLLELPHENSILAPDDMGFYLRTDKLFGSQISQHNPELVKQLLEEFTPLGSTDPKGSKDKLEKGESILTSHYFLNCLWIYDTALLKIVSKHELIECMNKYPLCRTNEMTVMNLVFHFRHHLWKPFPSRNSEGKMLFEWCETNHNFPTTWKDYCYMKYPITIGDI